MISATVRTLQNELYFMTYFHMLWSCTFLSVHHYQYKTAQKSRVLEYHITVVSSYFPLHKSLSKNSKIPTTTNLHLKKQHQSI